MAAMVAQLGRGIVGGSRLRAQPCRSPGTALAAPCWASLRRFGPAVL